MSCLDPPIGKPPDAIKNIIVVDWSAALRPRRLYAFGCALTHSTSEPLV